MIALFDIGGTHTRVAVSQDGKTFGELVVLDTPQPFEDGLEQLVRTIRELAGSEPIKTIAGGIAGPLDREHTMVVNAPNLPDWNGKPFAERLGQEFGGLVILENDTAIVGLGEAVAGAGQGTSIVAYMTVSTGINGVRIVDGRIDRNALGFELGHQIISSEHALCPTCNQPGHLEGLIGGRSLEGRYGKPPHELKDDAAIWDDVIRHLAIGIHNLIVHWSPEIVVLGGGMMKDIELNDLTDQVTQLTTIFPELPTLAGAELGDVGGLHGALELARQQSHRYKEERRHQ
jgi:predicted NBD/HSP70 family sugar kinase